MTLALIALLAVLVVGGGIAAVTVGVGRNRTRRNQVVPGVVTSAPSDWAGAHSREARLHRRLRDAVVGAQEAAPDGTGDLAGARAAIEAEALAVDARLVVVAAAPGDERAEFMDRVEQQVIGVEKAAAALAEARLLGDPLAEVEAELTRVRLLAEARAEVDQLDPLTATPTLPTAAPDEDDAPTPRATGA